MKDFPIKWWGSKLMVASKAINTIPNQYLSYSQNLRIYDWGIWPRKGKQLLTNSTLWTNNKGGFIMWGKLYQVANSKIYEVNTTTWVQTEKATLGYDAKVDILVYDTFSLITSEWHQIQVFDGTTLTTPSTQPATNNGIIEYFWWYSFIADNKTLYISRPIAKDYPTNVYDFTWSWNQTINWATAFTSAQNRLFKAKILWLKWTMNGIYIFTEENVEYINSNSLQNVAWSATFISTPIWDWVWPVSNFAITASWDKVFWLSKSKQIQTLNYVSWITNSQIWELSQRPVISVKKLLDILDKTQDNCFAFYNENDKTIQWHTRTTWSPINDITIVYDLVNDTWNIDTGKRYNYMVKSGDIYYGFSDVNSSIYLDDTWFSDWWVPIDTKLITQNIIIWPNQSIFGGFYVKGGIWNLTTINFKANVDWQNVFTDSYAGSNYPIPDLWEIWSEIGDIIAWPLTYLSELNPFDMRADMWRIWRMWNRIQYEISSNSQIQDFIIDMLWTTAEASLFTDQKNKF